MRQWNARERRHVTRTICFLSSQQQTAHVILRCLSTKEDNLTLDGVFVLVSISARHGGVKLEDMRPTGWHNVFFTAAMRNHDAALEIPAASKSARGFRIHERRNARRYRPWCVKGIRKKLNKTYSTATVNLKLKRRDKRPSTPRCSSSMFNTHA